MRSENKVKWETQLASNQHFRRHHRAGDRDDDPLRLRDVDVAVSDRHHLHHHRHRDKHLCYRVSTTVISDLIP